MLRKREKVKVFGNDGNNQNFILGKIKSRLNSGNLAAILFRIFCLVFS